MPISEKQLAANRANAAKSTGPRTSEGKSRSASNARKHCFTASSFTVVRLEDQPVNSQEQFALDRKRRFHSSTLAIAQQTILRAARLESGSSPVAPTTPSMETSRSPAAPRSRFHSSTKNRNFPLAEGFQTIPRQANGWTLFLRYQAQTERLYRRAVEEFDRLKACGLNYETKPSRISNPKKTIPLALHPANPLRPRHLLYRFPNQLCCLRSARHSRPTPRPLPELSTTKTH